MKPKRYIVWSTDELNLDIPFQKKWYIQQVLLHGRMEDVMELDFRELWELLPELELPSAVKSLWSDFLKGKLGVNEK